MSGPTTPAGRDLLDRHPDLGATEITEVELQAAGRALRADVERRDRVVDALRRVLSDDQRAAISAALTIDPDAIATLDDETLRLILNGFAEPRTNLDREAREVARADAARFLDEIM